MQKYLPIGLLGCVTAWHAYTAHACICHSSAAPLQQISNRWEEEPSRGPPTATVRLGPLGVRDAAERRRPLQMQLFRRRRLLQMQSLAASFLIWASARFLIWQLVWRLPASSYGNCPLRVTGDTRGRQIDGRPAAGCERARVRGQLRMGVYVRDQACKSVCMCMCMCMVHVHVHVHVHVATRAHCQTCSPLLLVVWAVGVANADQTGFRRVSSIGVLRSVIIATR